MTNKKPRRWRWILLGILVVLVLGAAGGGLGYYLAIQDRLKAEAGQVAMVTTTQFELGIADMNDGRLDMARKRFEYIIQLDPSFPGAEAKLADVMLQMAMISTPTEVVVPTPTLEPTPDFSGEEEIYNHAKGLLQNAQWVAALQTLDILRKDNAEYRNMDVDGMYYIALRNLGIDKIILEGNLEGGIYELTLAENFAPLDKEADGFRNWARYYLTGSSYWDLDWVEVLRYFGQVYAALPNLRDGAGWTATERFRVASIKYGDELMALGDYCAGRDQYYTAMALGVDNALVPTATQAQLLCAPPTATPAPATPTPEFVPTEPPVEQPTEVPVEETTEAPPAEPTATPEPEG